MPIYEYQCTACGHHLEKLQRMSDPVLTDCPACDQAGLKRLVSAAAFRLKGSGWYETDFKKGSKRNLHDSSHSGNGASRPVADTAKSPAKSSDTKSSNKASGKGSGKTASATSGAA